MAPDSPFADMAAFRARDWTRRDTCIYGSHGTPASFELEDRLAAIEGAAHCLLAPSGMAAVALACFALLAPGDELLVPANVYPATRRFVLAELAARGVGFRVYDPHDLDSLVFSEASRLVWVESPCSLTFAFADVEAIVARAADAGVPTVADASWAAGIAFRPHEHGVDACVQSLSKIAADGSGVLLGAVTCRDRGLQDRLRLQAMRLGLAVSSRDAESIAAGLADAASRYAQRDASTRAIVAALDPVAGPYRVLHPSLPGHPGHRFFRRDCSAAAPLFSLAFDAALEDAKVDAAIDSLRRFRIGYGWGGPHSRVVSYGRDVPFAEPLPGELMRFGVGDEPADELLADLERALAGLA